MSDDEQEPMEHAYDGIREYDNPLPGWWSWSFYGTIAFAAAYLVAVHLVQWVRTPAEKYATALEEYESLRGARDLAESANVNEGAIARLAADPQALADGRAVFVTRCASCHTNDGRGLIGPNLTDQFQLHGESRLDIFNTVKKGVPGTAMVAWAEQLPLNEILAVTAYVTTLRGQNLPGKQSEGLPVKPFANLVEVQ